MDNIIDFRRASASRAERSTWVTQLIPASSAKVSQLVRPEPKYRIHPERIRQHLDVWAELFFEKLMRLGQVTVENRSSSISFDSMLRVDDAEGDSLSFPVDNFLRLTMPVPSDATPENVDDYLVKILTGWSIQIGMCQEYDESDTFEQSELDESELSAFFPENVPVLLDANHPEENVYSCFFSEAQNYTASITAEYFLKPVEASLLELMCLARNDFVDAGNSLKSNGFMELELEMKNGIRITQIPLALVDRILAESILRKSPLTIHFEPETRIRKYCFAQVYPKVNPILYENDTDDE